MPIDYQNLLSRKTLERFKWALFISVPVWFGYGFARDPANLEWVKQAVSGAGCDRPIQHNLRAAPGVTSVHRVLC
jgi:hypothetical protein